MQKVFISFLIFSLMFVAFVGASPSVTGIFDGMSTVLTGVAQILKGLPGIFSGQEQRVQYVGDIPAHAATSCQQIASLRPEAESGYYWIQKNSVPVRVYCQMGGCCGKGAWMQAANINMTEINSECPSGLELITSPKRLCRRNVSSAGCSSSNFSTHGIPFSKVCGQVIGYQHHSTNAFEPYHKYPSRTIDDLYVDGVSITYSSHPRQHIWTFAAAYDGISSSPQQYSCPCVNSISRAQFRIPPFIGNDYYCETGSHTSVRNRYYLADPLWDGKGCRNVSTCCEGAMKPWFLKNLQQPVSSNIEARVCTDQVMSNEDVLIEIISIFVQ